MKKRFVKYLPVFVSVFVFWLVFLCSKTKLFTFLELKSYDSKVKFATYFRRPSDDIILVIVNQDSIDYAKKQYGWNAFPWQREIYGKILEFMDEGKASSVTFDILFENPSPFGEADDFAFAESLKKARNTESFLAEHWNGNSTNPVIIRPMRIFSENATFVSNTTSLSDSDGIIRRVRIRDSVDGENFTFMGFAPVIKDGPIPENLPLIRKANETVSVKLNYKGDVDLYPHYSAKEILESIDAIERGEEPEFEPSNFENAHVFVIYYAPGLFDICSTPISKSYPGAGVSITTLDNLINNDFIIEVPFWINLILLIVIIIMGFLFSTFAGKKETSAGVMFSNLLFFSYGIISIICMVYGIFLVCLDISFILLFSGFIFSYIANSMLDYLREGRQRRFIQNAFSQYLSPAFINQLIENPEKLSLGGERKQISIFFSDVENFTALSEVLSPNDLTGLLNLYLNELSTIILESGGTIDKFEGDAIIAFWNAPLEISEHSVKALEAAVKCQTRLEELEKIFIDKIGRPMKTRIGLNTGDAVVGNMGCKNRFDYTMLGDSVNLASRLEGLNKQFGTYIMCSENTKIEAEKHGIDLKFREIGKVQVVGKKEAVKVYEPMTENQYKAKKTEIEKFTKGLELFYAGDLYGAYEVFSENKKDTPSIKYGEKCRKIIKSEIAINDSWTGIWIADSK